MANPSEDSVLASRGPVTPQDAIPGRRIDIRTTAWTPLPADQILYAFLGSVVRAGLIEAPWTQGFTFRPDIVYVRTAKGVFATKLRTKKKLEQVIPWQWRSQVHRSLVVNVQSIAELDMPYRLRIHAGKDVEYLKVSRRNFALLIRHYGLDYPDFR